MLVILADDVTGALDAAAPFAGRGLRTEIALSVDAIALALREAPDVLSINLGCREISASEARRAMALALSELPAGATLFKKVDSRLKGNIAAELDEMTFSRALVAPAIPDFGRIVRTGHVEGFGIVTPIPVVEVLGEHADRCIIPDVTSRADMRRALLDAKAEGVDLFVGARGLAEALAESITGRAEASRAPIPDGKALLVIGSRDPITLAQVDALKQAVPVDYRGAVDGRLQETMPGDRSVVLVQALPGQQVVSPEDVSAALAASVVPQMTDGAKTWLLSGGATAQAVLAKAGISRLRLLGECLPGLGLAEANEHCIIAKSGGFGHPDTLAEIAAEILGTR